MKAKTWIAVLGVGLMGLATVSSWGQADQDPKIIGAYVGAVTHHQIWGSGAGVLFGFSLGYNNQGFHQAGLSTGSLFWNGRRYPLSQQMTVPPFPQPSNRNIDFYMTASATDLAQAPTWNLFGTLPYGKFDAVYLTDTRVNYQTNGVVPYLTLLDGTVILASTSADMEAGRVSTQVFRAPTSATRVRIRR